MVGERARLERGNAPFGLSQVLFTAAMLGLAYFVYEVATHAQLGPAKEPENLIARVAGWHDPVLVYFNLALFLGAVMMPAFVAWRYFDNCFEMKAARLRAEMGAAFTPERERDLAEYLKNVSFWSSAGSVIGVMLVVAIGSTALLFLNVGLVPDGAGARLLSGTNGLDYSRGANALILGPVMFELPNSAAFLERLQAGLVMFQFGFLGAFVFFLISLVRSYHALDLTPHTFVEGTVRMTTASLVSLVLSFLIPLQAPGAAVMLAMMAPAAFILGMFPRRALVLLDEKVSKYLGLKTEAYANTSLLLLPGMSPEHELRLIREGFDNVENLAHGNPFDLAIRTGLPYGQLKTWVEQAKLRACLDDDYAEFVAATGLRDLERVREEARRCRIKPLTESNSGLGDRLRGKLRFLLEPDLEVRP